jgi:hypothetical protein
VPTTFPTLKLAITNHLIDNWPATPICESGAGGTDITGQVTGSLFDSSHEFIEIDIGVTARGAAGVSRHSGTRVLAYLDVQMYIEPGSGTMRLAELESQLYPLVERKTIGGAEIRNAQGQSKPYEFRGRLTKIVSFPIEYFETT